VSPPPDADYEFLQIKMGMNESLLSNIEHDTLTSSTMGLNSSGVKWMDVCYHFGIAPKACRSMIPDIDYGDYGEDVPLFHIFSNILTHSIEFIDDAQFEFEDDFIVALQNIVDVAQVAEERETLTRLLIEYFDNYGHFFAKKTHYGRKFSIILFLREEYGNKPAETEALLRQCVKSVLEFCRNDDLEGCADYFKTSTPASCQ